MTTADATPCRPRKEGPRVRSRCVRPNLRRRRRSSSGASVPVARSRVAGVWWMMRRIDDQPPSPPPSSTERATAFLKTGTGLVAAITAFLVAIAGLVAAVTQLGGGSHSDSGPTPGGGTTTVLFQSTAQRELQSHVPGSIWPSCGPPVTPEEHAVAAF